MPEKYAYLGIRGGRCRAVTADTGDKRTADDVADFMRVGCTIERVAIEVARKALFEPWPPVAPEVA